MEKKLGKIEIVIEDIDGSGEYIQLNPDELAKMGLKTGDWVKWVLNDNDKITIEKPTKDEIIAQI